MNPDYFFGKTCYKMGLIATKIFKDNAKILPIPITEFSVSVCSIPKFICSSDDGVPRCTENISFKSNIYKNMMI